MRRHSAPVLRPSRERNSRNWTISSAPTLLRIRHTHPIRRSACSFVLRLANYTTYHISITISTRKTTRRKRNQTAPPAISSIDPPSSDPSCCVMADTLTSMVKAACLVGMYSRTQLNYPKSTTLRSRWLLGSRPDPMMSFATILRF